MSSTDSTDENNKGHRNDVDETKESKPIHNNKVSDRVKEKEEEEESRSSSTVPAEE
jgi:hypothetical protein